MEQLPRRKPLFIGVSGSTGTGKTVFAHRLADEIGAGDCLLIQQDSYYRDRSHLPRDEAERSNYDHPDAIDFPLLVHDLNALRMGNPVRIPHYDYSSHRRSMGEKEAEHKKVVILEGILIYHSKKIREMLDLKIFLDAEEEVRLSRRIERDIRERGRTREEIITQYYKTVKPMNEAFVVPCQQLADIIVPLNRDNPLAIRIIASYIRSVLNG